MRSELRPLPLPVLAAPIKARTPRKRRPSGTLSDCRLLGWKLSSLNSNRGPGPMKKIWFF